jgi:hypothetical protein
MTVIMTVASRLLSCCYVSSSAYSLTLKMEAIYSSETSVDFQRTTWCHIQKIVLFMITTVGTSDSVRCSLIMVFQFARIVFFPIYCDGFGVSYATTSQNTGYIRCDHCYSEATQQFLTVKFPKQPNCCETEATENTAVRGVFYSWRKHSI